MGKGVRGVRGPLVVTLDNFDVEEIQIQRGEWIIGESGRSYVWHIAVMVGILKHAMGAVHPTRQEIEPLGEV